MLRALVAVLLLANLAFWAWSAGTLEGIGLGPARERDPARLSQQVQPDAVRVLPPTAAVAALSAASAAQGSGAALACLEAGPFAPATIDAAERTLAASIVAGVKGPASRHSSAAPDPCAALAALAALSAATAAAGGSTRTASGCTCWVKRAGSRSRAGPRPRPSSAPALQAQKARLASSSTATRARSMAASGQQRRATRARHFNSPARRCAR